MYKCWGRLVCSWMLLLICSFSGAFAQTSSVTISGLVKDKVTKTGLPFVGVVIKKFKDSVFVTGTVTNEEGRFSMTGIKPGQYYLEISYIGYVTQTQPLFVGSLSEYLNVDQFELQEKTATLHEVVVTGKADQVNDRMDKKTFSIQDNISQSGGSV